ncbi:hypothetical protein [Natrinema sp. HArc-T2]|uniref:hypothetical protein n=1 Tax=Natrinema sp. HArc-T2 TaxID=3242701 RepID=UPI00359D13EE
MNPRVEEQLSHVVDLCERHNISGTNLLWDDYVPEKVDQEYNELKQLVEDDPSVHASQLEQMVDKRVDLDFDELQKLGLWDIDVEIKRNRAIEEYPELEEHLDTGLVQVEYPVEYNKNGWEYKNHYLIMPHSLYYNFRFTQNLFSKWNGDFELRVAFDPHSIGLRDTAQEMFLAGHWFGPKSLEAVRSSFEPEVLIVHGSKSYDEGIQDKTEFLFKNRGDEWILEIEELLPRRGIGYSVGTELRNDYLDYYTRYTHAVLSEDLRKCIHLDGALREYPSRESFIQRHTNSSKRLDCDWPTRVTNRYKLFQLDASDDTIPDFQELIGLFHYFCPHIIEFFEGENEKTRKIEQDRARFFQRDLDQLP